MSAVMSSMAGPPGRKTVDVQTRQAVAAKLAQIQSNLSWSGAPQAAWLTYVRNGINYDHKWSAWWPYSGRPKYYDRLGGRNSSWRDDPLDIELSEDRDMLRYQATCNFLISACGRLYRTLRPGVRLIIPSSNQEQLHIGISPSCLNE